MTRAEPHVDVCEKRYVFDARAPGNASTPLTFHPREKCPPYEIPEAIASAVKAKEASDERAFAEYVNRGVATAPVKTGTDGGMHNFLRYLENRGANGAQVNYAGSMISMYYSQYATGNFKCCTSVYGAPQRNYFFDTQFENPTNLPPGTPSFQDVVSLGYHQAFTPQ